MNTLEREQLQHLLKQLVEVKLTNKDSEAEAMIREAAAHQPDAAYLLSQRVMLLEQALNAAKTRIEELQKQSQQTTAATSFLGSDPWAAPAANSAPVPGVTGYQVPRATPQAQSQPASGFLGGGSSFLGNIATTAAGVVAGSFLFQGIENLLGHHNGGFGGSGFGQPEYGEQITEQTIVNNYYGDDSSDTGQFVDSSNYGDDYFANDSDSDFQDDAGDSDWV